MRVSVVESRKQNPTFEKLRIHNMEKWSPELLDAVFNSPGIKAAAKKYESFTVYNPVKNAIFATADEAWTHKFYIHQAITGTYKRTKTPVQKIMDFNVETFDAWYKNVTTKDVTLENRLAKYNEDLFEKSTNQTSKPAQKLSFIQKFLNFFK